MSDAATPMTSYRPYLLRALYEWIADNGMTPHLLVEATRPGVVVPAHAVKEGKVVLNIAERAVAHLHMDNEVVTFQARFGGVSHSVAVPVSAVLAIYARETGHGMALPDDGLATARSGGEAAADPEPAEDAPPRPVLTPVPSDNAPDDGPDDDGPDRPGPRRGGHLRLVK